MLVLGECVVAKKMWLLSVIDGVCHAGDSHASLVMRFRPGASRSSKATAPTGVEWLAAALGPELGGQYLKNLSSQFVPAIQQYWLNGNRSGVFKIGKHEERTMHLRSVL